MKELKLELTGTAEELAKVLAGITGKVTGKVTAKSGKSKPDPEEDEDEEDPEEDENEDADDAEEDDDEGVTMASLREAVLAKSKISEGVKAKVKALLLKFGAEKVTALPEPKWEKFKIALDKITK